MSPTGEKEWRQQALKHYTKNDFITRPWKNGGGTTLELFKLPKPCGDEFLFRLSVATIERPGPFSKFEGIDRHLYLLDGNGVILTFPNQRVVNLTKPREGIAFAGEDEIFGTPLNGPSKDFNVMFDRRWAKVSTKIIEVAAGDVLELPKMPWAFLYQPRAEILTELKNSSFGMRPSEDAFFFLVELEPIVRG